VDACAVVHHLFSSWDAVTVALVITQISINRRRRRRRRRLLAVPLSHQGATPYLWRPCRRRCSFQQRQLHRASFILHPPALRPLSNDYYYQNNNTTPFGANFFVRSGELPAVVYAETDELLTRLGRYPPSPSQATAARLDCSQTTHCVRFGFDPI
jgi:hypothetical protein